MGKTMHVPADIQMRIRLLVDEGIRKAEKHYGIQLPSPKIEYTVTGRTAGYAQGRDWMMNLNSVLLMENVEDFIMRTPLHELGHLVQYRVYPHTLTGQNRTDTGRREKRSVHGEEWRECCRVVGLDDTKRTHNYDTSNARKNTNRTIYDYVCLSCKKDIRVTAKRHTMILNGTRKYHCAACRGPIALKSNIKTMMVGNMPVALIRPPAPPTAGKSAPTEGKIGHCWRLYKRWKHIYDRKSLIAVFVNEADCTPAGASTYYATCQKYEREGYI